MFELAPVARELVGLVRDTKNRQGAVLAFSPQAWRRFAERVKASA